MDVDIDNLPTKITQANIRKAATSKETIEKIKRREVNIVQQSLMDVIRDDIQKKPLMDQWYKKPNRTKIHKDNPTILLEDPYQQDKWEQIA